ncbi:uncharacterized protein LOC111397917 [Olea europaea var. sylvestris]|uniref:uncharacterized protein LOC111397917 n=1 Tax=Olea europaea var. sylvestris TaxID=158386 RepID=UPI000C1D0584|nr:uncharacterized protein LOC111397917 [Olea europaea var. sylvestris]
MGILETKLDNSKLSRVMRNKFGGFNFANNFAYHDAGQILILWDFLNVDLDVLEATTQLIHYSITCKVTSRTFFVSFVYAFNIIVPRRPLWHDLEVFGLNCSSPWLVLGDFNNVLNFDEKSNGADITPYEIKDFDMCCQNIGLSDLRSIGCFSTWNNNFVWSKLDRAMVNEAWMIESFDSFANFVPQGCLSDHSPCIVTLFRKVERKRRPFKFFNMWTRHDEFFDLVSLGWSKVFVGTKQFSLCKKLHSLKGLLKKMNAKHFAHISSRAEIVHLRKEANTLCEAERSFYYQKAKYVHLKNSDKCTKYFHSLANRNVKRNFILAILMRDGFYSTSLEEVGTEFTHFYKIKEALFSIGDDKAPGSDGFTSCLFKKSWDIIGNDFMDAIEEFFVLRSLLKQINHTILALPMLDSIVDQAQSAFVEGRSMIENIHLVQELLRQYNHKRVVPRCLLKIDLTNAFDSVNWESLEEVLKGLGFPNIFVEWIINV